MTKNRARKQAARDRAALTGERYVVAQRAVAESAVAGSVAPPASSGRLHDLTHRMPGVPAHVDGGLQAAAPSARTANAHRNANPAHSHRTRHQEPKVLVGWQNWIARRVTAVGDSRRGL